MLVVALALSQIGRAGPLIWYLSPGANFVLREMGIVLFLSCVGLKSGSRFLDVLLSGSGVYWMLAGSFLTLAPLVLALFHVCRTDGAQAEFLHDLRGIGRQHDRSAGPCFCGDDHKIRPATRCLRGGLPVGDDSSGVCGTDSDYNTSGVKAGYTIGLLILIVVAILIVTVVVEPITGCRQTPALRGELRSEGGRLDDDSDHDDDQDGKVV
jgi:hypothetical protein